MGTLTRSLLVGGAATAFDLLALLLLVRVLGWAPVAANLPALLLGLTLQFVGNKLWVFRDRSRALVRQGSLFALVEAGTLVLNAALFHVDWENMQISGTPENSALGYTTNAGDTHTEGLELELTTRPLPGLDITLGGALMEAELDDPAENGAAGNRLPHTVEEEGSLSAQYRFSLTQRIGAFVRGDLQYRGDAFSDVQNRPQDHTDSYTLGNLNFGVELGPFELTAFWRNVTDERAQLVRFGSAAFGELGGTNVYRNQPETVGLTIRFSG